MDCAKILTPIERLPFLHLTRSLMEKCQLIGLHWWVLHILDSEPKLLQFCLRRGQSFNALVCLARTRFLERHSQKECKKIFEFGNIILLSAHF